MDEILKQILQQLQELKEGQTNLENRLGDRIDSVETNLSDKINSLEKKMNVRFDGVEQKINTVYDQVGDLVEFKIVPESKLERIK